MHEQSHSESNSIPAADAVRVYLDKILASRTFRAADLQRKFLRYAVEQTLASKGHLIKEYVIATEGLGRGEAFDPRLDAIVRTEARKLRARLAKYYETEGLVDPLRIDFPKGAYVPSFRTVEPIAAPPDEAETPAPLATPEGGAGSIGVEHPAARFQPFVLAAIALLLAAGAAAVQYRRGDANSVTLPARSNAYRDYQRGRYYFVRFTPDSLGTAIGYFEKAIDRDPSFARAYVGLADSYLMQPQIVGAPPRELIVKARSAARRALALDPSLGEAYFDLAVCAEYDFDWATAEAAFKKGLSLTPQSTVGHLWYAKFLAILGRKSEVLMQRRVAAELDPVSPYALQSVAGYYSVVGRYDEAIGLFQDAIAIEPRFGLSHQGLGIAYLLKDMKREAVAELKTAAELMNGPRTAALLGYAYAVTGQRDEARQILDPFLERFGRQAFPALPIAQIYIGLGDKDRAFEWLEKAIEQRDLDVTLQWDSPYQTLRDDPRYVRLLRRMKLL